MENDVSWQTLKKTLNIKFYENPSSGGRGFPCRRTNGRTGRRTDTTKLIITFHNVNKKVQPDATVCRHLFTAQSFFMFRVSQHPSSGVLNTVSATSGIGHDTGTATSFQRGLVRPRWKEVAVPVSWPIPEVADTVFSTPDDGCCDTRNM